MIKRREVGKHAQITFTRNFHELVTGDLRPGHSVVLSYDPDRIVPPQEQYVFGDPTRPIVAHVQFHRGDPPMNLVLASPGGLIANPDKDVTGQGSMLKTRFMIPSDADWLIAWFSYLSLSGATLYDSDYGENFIFSFPCRDVAVLSADLVSDPQTPYSGLAIQIATAPGIEAVSARFRSLGTPTAPSQEVSLERTGRTDAHHGWPVWSIAGVPVPYRSVVRFKVYYWIRGHRFKDDNTGNYYFAPQPPPDKVPPPPQELARAALAWK